MSCLDFALSLDVASLLDLIPRLDIALSLDVAVSLDVALRSHVAIDVALLYCGVVVAHVPHVGDGVVRVMPT
jgi:hypothetical protein